MSGRRELNLPQSSSLLRMPSDLNAPFRDFHSKEHPFEATVFLLLLVTTYAALSVVGLSHDAAEPDDAVLSKLSFALAIPMVLVGWAVIYLKYTSKYKAEQYSKYWSTHGILAQNVFCLALVVFAGLRLCAKMSYGSCSNLSEVESLYCNPNHASRGFPEESLLALSLIPTIYPIVLRDTDWSVVTASWIISVVFMAIGVAQDGSSRGKVISLIMFTTCSALALYSNQMQNVRSFVVQQQLAAVIKQNEEIAEELRANELRHMIGNVAHDLKTPLTSFVSGLDLIADIAQDGLRKMQAIESAPAEDMSLASSSKSNKSLAKEVKSLLQQVQSCAQNSRNVNNFMMMTINRAIDYTKASRGLKLVPKYETIDLVETLSWPFKCMRDVTAKVHVFMDTPSNNICSHVITDKQWLQENILCLLSNAAKYSVGGRVDGHITLTTAGEVGPGSSCELPPGCYTEGRPIHGEVVSYIAPQSPTASSSLPIFPKGVGLVSRFVGKKYRQVVVSPDKALDLDEGGPEAGRIELSTTKRFINPKQEVLLIQVEDTGVGLSEEVMESMFNAFKQPQSLSGGTGLGMFSLARRVEALGGEYGVKKRVDGNPGATFWFTIPYRPDERAITGVSCSEEKAERRERARLNSVATLPPPLSTKPTKSLNVNRSSVTTALPFNTNMSGGSGVKSVPSSPSASAGSRKLVQPIVSDAVIPTLEPWQQPDPRVRLHDTDSLRILIVDDSPAIQKLMSMMLRRQGHEIDQADNGATAVALITSTHNDEHQGCTAYDVVLMDLQMPVMDGLEATRRIRQAEQDFSLRLAAEAVPNTSDLTPSGRHRELENPTKAIHQLIIGVSANSDNDTMNEAFAAGIDSFIAKPFSVDVFYRTFNNNCSGLPYKASNK